MSTQVPYIELKQTKAHEKTLILRPNADTPIKSGTPYPNDGINYTKVDEVYSDDDTTYVYKIGGIYAYFGDLYGVPNHTTETGTITKVIFNAVAKAENPISQTDFFKINRDFVPPAMSNSSSVIQLVTSYKQYQWIQTINNITGLPFTWTDIDGLLIGWSFRRSSAAPTYKTFTCRPDGTGDSINLSTYGDSPNYKCVDDASYDDDTTYVYTTDSASFKDDLYTLENHTTETGTITNVTVFMRLKGEDYFKAIVKTGGFTHYSGSRLIGSGSWHNYSYSWNVNPQTGIAWTWADIDGLQAGISLKGSSARCTQLYVIVEYTGNVNGCRVTQSWIEVFYEEQLEGSLPKPKSIDTNHERNINTLNFWSGNREVYDIGRSNKSVVFTGRLWNDCAIVGQNSETIINNIRELGKAKEEIAIDGMRYDEFNTRYYIKSFGWTHVSKKPNVYDWMLELDFSEL